MTLRHGMILAAILLTLGGCASGDNESPDPVVDQSTFLRLAEKSAAKQDFDMAAAMYQKAAAEDPKSLPAWLGLAKSLAAMGNSEEAMEAMKKAADLNPNDLEVNRTLAGMLVSQMHLAEAEKTLIDALNMKPNGKMYNLLGVVYDLQNKPQLAVQSYYSGLVLAPDDLNLLTNLGLSYGLGDKASDGIKLLQRVTSNPASTARQRQNLALLYVINNQPILAEKILRMDGDDAVVEKNMRLFHKIAKMKPGADRIQSLVQMAQ